MNIHTTNEAPAEIQIGDIIVNPFIADSAAFRVGTIETIETSCGTAYRFTNGYEQPFEKNAAFFETEGVPLVLCRD